MIYIAGKITDSTLLKERQNKKRFFKKAAELQKQGFEVYNPVKNDIPDQNYEHYLIKDFLWIVKNKPDMYFLKGWETSNGAKLENELAKQLKLKIIYETRRIK